MEVPGVAVEALLGDDLEEGDLIGAQDEFVDLAGFEALADKFIPAPRGR